MADKAAAVAEVNFMLKRVLASQCIELKKMTKRGEG